MISKKIKKRIFQSVIVELGMILISLIYTIAQIPFVGFSAAVSDGIYVSILGSLPIIAFVSVYLGIIGVISLGTILGKSMSKKQIKARGS